MWHSSRKSNMVTEFEKAVAEHTAWLQQSAQLLDAAEVLCINLRNSGPALRDDAGVGQVGCLKGAMLLLAFAVENTLKAVKAAKGDFIIDHGAVKTRSLGGGASGHDLQVLAQNIGLTITECESELLTRLTSIAVWAGRYPYPLSSATYLDAVLNDPRKLKLPADIRTARTILEKAAKLLPGPPPRWPESYW